MVKYKIITKNRKYKDISLLGVLKTLYKRHRITKYQYKDSIKRIINHRKLKNNIKAKMQYYLFNIRANTLKNSLSAQHKAEQQNKRFIALTYKGLNYAVFIKKRCFNKVLRNHININDVQLEFNQLINRQNDIVVL